MSARRRRVVASLSCHRRSAADALVSTVTPASRTALATLSAEVNASVENIGARRLHTVMERLLEEVSFTATDKAGETITVDAAFVQKHVGDLAKNADLSKFIL